LVVATVVVVVVVEEEEGKKPKKKKCREIPVSEVFDLLASRVMGLVFLGKKER
jgi:hypothetical protein